MLFVSYANPSTMLSKANNDTSLVCFVEFTPSIFLIFMLKYILHNTILDFVNVPCILYVYKLLTIWTVRCKFN